MIVVDSKLLVEIRREDCQQSACVMYFVGGPNGPSSASTSLSVSDVARMLFQFEASGGSDGLPCWDTVGPTPCTFAMHFVVVTN
jgi:hypothetical protein